MSNMVVRTNIFALNAHRNMKNVGLEQGRASNRLSSGFRINSAADDAAGLAISETMRAQIRGLDQASRNAQDGQAMLLTTEGGLEEIGNMLQRTRELLVQASNDTNTQDQRTMIEQEIRQLAQEISSMQQRVEFNTNRVLAMGPAMVGSVAADMAQIQEDMVALSDAFGVVNTNLHNVAVAREILSAMPPLASISTLNDGQRAALELALAEVNMDAVDAARATADVQAAIAGLSDDTVLTAAEIEAGEAMLGEPPVLQTLNMSAAIGLLDDRNGALQDMADTLNNSINALHRASTETFSLIRDFQAFRAVGTESAATTVMEGAQAGEWLWTPAAVGGFAPGQLGSTVSNTPPTAGNISIGVAAPSTGSVNYGLFDFSVTTVAVSAVYNTVGAYWAAPTATPTAPGSAATAFTIQVGGGATAAGATAVAGTWTWALASTPGTPTAYDAPGAAWQWVGAAQYVAGTAGAERVYTTYQASPAGTEDVWTAVLNTAVAAIEALTGTPMPSTHVHTDAAGHQFAFDGTNWFVFNADYVPGTAAGTTVAPTGIAPPADPANVFGAASGVTIEVGGEVLGTWTWTPAVAGDPVEVPESEYYMEAGSTGNNVAFFQVGANANQGITFDFETVSRTVTAAASVVTMIGTLISNPGAGSGIGRGISVTPLINQIQASLDDVNTVRANLGAVQNRMDFTMRSLDISSENLQDSESRVRNADIPREMMRFTMTNVLQQAAVSMLAQANQLPNNLLQLLR